MSSQIFKQLLLNAPRRIKQSLAAASDIFFCAVASAIAMGLRTDAWGAWGQAHGWMTLAGVIVALPVFTGFGLYRAIFRYSGLPAMTAVARAMLLDAEKNASSPLPSGSSVGATATAPPVDRSALTAPRG